MGLVFFVKIEKEMIDMTKTESETGTDTNININININKYQLLIKNYNMK